MAFEQAALVGHRATAREAVERANREGHGGLAGQRILGGFLTKRDGGTWGNGCIVLFVGERVFFERHDHFGIEWVSDYFCGRKL